MTVIFSSIKSLKFPTNQCFSSCIRLKLTSDITKLAVSRKNFMEDLYGEISSKVLKLKVLNANVSPINVQREKHQFFVGHHRPSKSPNFDSYASIDRSNLENLDSTLIRYLRSVSPSTGAGNLYKTPLNDAGKYRSMIGGRSSGYGSVSPLSAIENLENSAAFRSPVKEEEDVLVMDGILVGSIPGGGGAMVRSSVTSDSGGSSSSSSGGKSFYKTEFCRSWEDSDSCRYGYKCQFAHGQEEQRPGGKPAKNKSKGQTSKLSTSGSGSGTQHDQVIPELARDKVPPPGNGIKGQTSKSSTSGSGSGTQHDQVIPELASEEFPVLGDGIKAQKSKLFASSSWSGTSGATCWSIPHDQGTPTIAPTEPALATTEKTVSPIKSEPTSDEWSHQDDGIKLTLPSSDSTEKAPSKEQGQTSKSSASSSESGANREGSWSAQHDQVILSVSTTETALAISEKTVSAIKHEPASDGSPPLGDGIKVSSPSSHSTERAPSKEEFAHGREELRPAGNPTNNKFEGETSKTPIGSSGTSTSGAKSPFGQPDQVIPAILPTVPEPEAASIDWSPEDDGISVTLPSSASPENPASREEVNAHIHNVLHGPSWRKRLPAFTEIVPE